MANMAQNDRDDREGSFDSLFESSPPQEVASITGQSQSSENDHVGIPIDPPTPGGIFVTDDEEREQPVSPITHM